MEPRNDDARTGQGAGTDEAAERSIDSVGKLTQASKYLAVRPSTRTSPPRDDRMSKAQRWVTWGLRKAEGNRKPSKVPGGEVNAPSSWTYFHAARASLADPKVAGLGFQMHDNPGVVGIDIDKCIDAAGTPTPRAAQLLAILEAAGGRFHVEVTPSGNGYRIFAGETPLPFHDYTNHDTGFEVYTGESPRFLTVTGKLVRGFGEGPFDPLPAEAVELLGKVASPGKWKQGAARADGAAEPVPASEPLPELSRRDDWKKLQPAAIKRLSKEHRDFLDTGALGSKYASASEQLFAIEQSLLKHLKPPQAYQILISADGSWGVALEHREGNETKAKAFIWQDLERAAASKEKHEQEKAAEATGWKECEIEVEITEDGARAKWLQLNILNTFKHHAEWKARLGYNTFDGRVTLDRKDVESDTLIYLSAWTARFLKWQSEHRRDVFEEALTAAAKSRPWNPMEEELRAATWDGTPRVRRFAEALSAGTAPGGLALDEQILRKWLIAFVARGIQPGCEMHNVLSLVEREGGAYKTRFCRVMAGGAERFSDSPSFASDKDSSMLRAGMRIIELGEGVAARKADKYELKKDITKLDDHFRPPWGRSTEKRKRGFVYVLTSNDEAFLRSDQDGLRRIWPMNARDVIDIEWIEANREQLLAEAVVAYDAGERWWWDKGEEPEALKVRQLGAVAEDPLDGAVEAVIADAENKARGYTTLNEVARCVEAISGMQLNAAMRNHLITVLIKKGMINQGKTWIGEKNKQIRTWRHPSWNKGDAKVIELPLRPGAAGTSGLSAPPSEGVDVGNA